MTRLTRRMVRPYAVAASCLLALTLVATLGGHLPTTRALPSPPALSLNVGPDPAGLSFPRVTAEFLSDALGPSVGEVVAPTPVPSGALPGHPSPPPRPEGSTRSPPPGEGQPPPPKGLPPPIQFSELTVAMRADRAEVRPGDTITYRAIVTNVGNQDFRGTYRLDSHIPFGTVDATSPCGGTLGIDPENSCVNPPFPTPGSADPSVHQLSSTFNGSIRRGQRHITVFKVRVNETTQPGTRLQNHVHLDIIGDSEAVTNSNSVVVVVRRSNAVSSSTERGTT